MQAAKFLLELPAVDFLVEEAQPSRNQATVSLWQLSGTFVRAGRPRQPNVPENSSLSRLACLVLYSWCFHVACRLCFKSTAHYWTSGFRVAWGRNLLTCCPPRWLQSSHACCAFLSVYITRILLVYISKAPSLFCPRPLSTDHSLSLSQCLLLSSAL